MRRIEQVVYLKLLSTLRLPRLLPPVHLRVVGSGGRPACSRAEHPARGGYAWSRDALPMGNPFMFWGFHRIRFLPAPMLDVAVSKLRSLDSRFRRAEQQRNRL